MWKSYKSGGDELHANQLPLLGPFICTEHTLGMKKWKNVTTKHQEHLQKVLLIYDPQHYK